MNQKQHLSNTKNRSNFDNPENWPSLSNTNPKLSPRLQSSYKCSGTNRKKQNASSQSNSNDQRISENNEITFHFGREDAKDVKQLSTSCSSSRHVSNKSDNDIVAVNSSTKETNQISDDPVRITDKPCHNNIENSSGNANIEDLKEIRKLNRIRAKKEKQRKREEEIRRQKIEPKSEHFKIVDSKFKTLFDSVSRGIDYLGEKHSAVKGAISNHSDARISNEFHLERNLSEFPDLQFNGKLKYEMDKKDFKQNQQVRVVQRKINVKFGGSSKDVMGDAVKNNVESLPKGLVSIPREGVAVSKTKRRIKRNTPIEFDLVNALQRIKLKQVGHHKSNYVKRNLKSANVLSKRNTLCGNKLDSDNPVRRKGKYRENKKKKYTRLKKCLLNERLLKKSLIDSANIMLESDKKLLLDNGLDKSLFFQLMKCQTSVSLDEDPNRITNNDLKEDVDKKSELNTNVDPKTLIHTRKFRSYCDQWPFMEMKQQVCCLIKTVLKFQDRAYANDPIKAHAKRRFVCGFHEAMRFLRINKVKLMIIATDLECTNGDDGGSLMECVKQMTTTAEALSVPYVYSGTRWSIKTAFKKTRPISCAAILNYEGAEELFKRIIGMLPQVKNTYIEKLKAAEIECGIRNDIKEDVANECIRSMLDRLAINDIDERKTVNESNSLNMDAANIKEEIENETPFMNAILKCT